MDWLELFTSLLVGSFIAFFSFGFIGIMSEMYAKVYSGDFGDKNNFFNKVWRTFLYPFAFFGNIFFEKLPYGYFIWWILWILYFYFAFIGKLPLIF